jgi:hypothetical protein
MNAMFIRHASLVAARIFLLTFGMIAFCWLLNALLRGLGPWGNSCPIMW